MMTPTVEKNEMPPTAAAMHMGLEKNVCQRLDVGEQSARLLGVEFADMAWSSHTTYGTDHASLAVFRTTCGRYLVVSLSNDCFDAACVDVLETSLSQCYDDRRQMRAVAEEVGIIAPLDLYDAYREADMSGTLSSDRSRGLIEVNERDPDGREALQQEICEARQLWKEHDQQAADDTAGLSVRRYIDHDDDISWVRSFGQDYDMTVVLDDGAEKLSDAALPDLVLGRWDERGMIRVCPFTA